MLPRGPESPPWPSVRRVREQRQQVSRKSNLSNENLGSLGAETIARWGFPAPLSGRPLNASLIAEGTIWFQRQEGASRTMERALRLREVHWEETEWEVVPSCPELWKVPHCFSGLVELAVKKGLPVIILENYNRYFTCPKDDVFGRLEYLKYWFLKLPGGPEWPGLEALGQVCHHSRSGSFSVCPTSFQFYWAFFQKRREEKKMKMKESVLC